MKKAKFRAMFFALLGLASVFLCTSTVLNAECAPSKAAAYHRAEPRTLTANFEKKSGDYDENCRSGMEIFPEDRSISCTAYRYPMRKDNIQYDSFTLLPKTYRGEAYKGKIDIDFDPLPGMLANTTPIKGITRIEATFEGDGMLYVDNRSDFQHDVKMGIREPSFVFTSDEDYDHNEYPCFFRLVAFHQDIPLRIKTLKITHNPDLGRVIQDDYPSGYGLTRFKVPEDPTQGMPDDVDDNFNITRMRTNFNPEDDDRHLNTIVNQLALFKTGIHNSTINRYNDKAYDRTDGYVTAFGEYFKPQTYYEYDLPIDPKFHPRDKRGAGRLVLFPEGLNCLGYENQPFIVFTDDHYFTFREYLNYSKGGVAVFGPPFDAEGILTGYKWSPARTVGVEGSGTKTAPAPLNPKLTISPTPDIWVDVNERIQLRAFKEDTDFSGHVYFNTLEQTGDCITIDDKGLLTAKNYGNAVIQGLTYHKFVPLYSNKVNVHITKLKNITCEGNYLKTYYEGNIFNPTGLTVKAHYEDGTSQVLNADDCKWYNAYDNSIKLSLGQKTIFCQYKSAFVELDVTVLKKVEATSVKINLPSGMILGEHTINLKTIVTPVGASNDTKWFAVAPYDDYEIDYKEGEFTPYRGSRYVAVNANTPLGDLINYYQIVDSLTFYPIDIYEELIEEEYVIGTPRYLYDPSFTINKGVRLTSGTNPIIDLHNATSLVFIRKSPKEGNYYHIQRIDNQRYIGFNPLDNTLTADSINPIDNCIEFQDMQCKIYNQDKTKVLQYNNDTSTFGFYPDGTQTQMVIYRKELHFPSDFTIKYGFGCTYLHMIDYNDEMDYCKDWQHNYFNEAKRAFMLIPKHIRLDIATDKGTEAHWARFNAWARACNTEIILDNEGNVTFNYLSSKETALYQDSNSAIIITISLLSGLSFMFFFIIKRKHLYK